MTKNETIDAMRQSMREERQLKYQEYYQGRISAFRTAIYWLTESTSGCPDCHAKLPNDGSCCDACGWVQLNNG